MKNYILFWGLMMLNVASDAQKSDENYDPAQYKSSTCEAYFVKFGLDGENNAGNIAGYLKSNLSNLKDERVGLKFNYRNESPGGFHYSFIQTYAGIEVYQSEVKVNLDRQNMVHSIFDNSENTESWNISLSPITQNSVIIRHPETRLPVLAERTIDNFSREVISANGEVIFERNLNSYFLPPDSLVTGKVFNPDPLTTSQNIYGAPFADDSNRTNSFLDAEMQTVSFTANFSGGVFALNNQYVKVTDFDLPNFAPATSVTPQFNFDRSQSGFEDVNAYYHISTMREYVHNLGFNCADVLVDIDPHAGTADNSFFAPGYTPKRISFGTGGVDDAEDADVCVHEYAHFISDNAAPNSNAGQQRNALDEGFGDYLAASYSANLSAYNRHWVYNWDGHNEFWKGRVLNTLKIYPDSLSNSIYRNGEMWSTALFNINLEIGRGAMDSLILQTHYSYAQNISMADAAQLLIDADILLNNGAYYCPIYRHLFTRGFVAFDPNATCAVGIEENEQPVFQFFQNGNSFTVLNAEEQKTEMQLINVNGQLTATAEINQPVFTYRNENIGAGVYLVILKTARATQTYKWCKAN